ncbi:MAG: hypothetical protein KDK04_06790, partial [Candidatus Competibacteraceae bacterium]|nr:hypothetical protein [Candidatus Competibacteraceae bacterium]
PTLSVGLAGHIYSVEAAPDSATGIESASGGDNVLNVLNGDTIGGVAATIGNATLAVASGSSVPAGLTFDTATGNVDVLAGTAPDSYSFDYEICETGYTLCATATVTVTVIDPAAICPAGTTLETVGTGYLGYASAISSNFNTSNAGDIGFEDPLLALGGLSPAGQDAYSVSAKGRQDDVLVVELDDFVPGGETLRLSVAAWYDPQLMSIQLSHDDLTYVNLGTVGNGGSLANFTNAGQAINYVDVTVPPAGARYVRFESQGGMFVDGVAYTTACTEPPPPPVTVDVPQFCGDVIVQDFGTDTGAGYSTTLPTGVSIGSDFSIWPANSALFDGNWTLAIRPADDGGPNAALDLLDNFGGGNDDIWHDDLDHTDDTDGYMLVVNAAETGAGNEFFRQSFS